MGFYSNSLMMLWTLSKRSIFVQHLFFPIPQSRRVLPCGGRDSSLSLNFTSDIIAFLDIISLPLPPPPCFRNISSVIRNKQIIYDSYFKANIFFGTTLLTYLACVYFIFSGFSHSTHQFCPFTYRLSTSRPHPNPIRRGRHPLGRARERVRGYPPPHLTSDPI